MTLSFALITSHFRVHAFPQSRIPTYHSHTILRREQTNKQTNNPTHPTQSPTSHIPHLILLSPSETKLLYLSEEQDIAPTSPRTRPGTACPSRPPRPTPPSTTWAPSQYAPASASGWRRRPRRAAPSRTSARAGRCSAPSRPRTPTRPASRRSSGLCHSANNSTNHATSSVNTSCTQARTCTENTACRPANLYELHVTYILCRQLCASLNKPTRAYVHNNVNSHSYIRLQNYNYLYFVCMYTIHIMFVLGSARAQYNHINIQLQVRNTK